LGSSKLSFEKLSLDLQNFLDVVRVKQLAGILEGGLHVLFCQRQRLLRYVVVAWSW
jgi:hypothetical protein